MTKEERNAVSSLELKTFLDLPVYRFEIKVKDYKWWHKLMMKPKAKEFVLYKTRLCNMGRCSEIGFRMPELSGSVGNLYDLIKIAYPLVRDHRKDVLYLVAACIQNSSKEPKLSLIKFIDDNCSAEMLNEIVSMCILNSDLQSFTATSLLIKGVSVTNAREEDADSVTKQD